MRCGYVLFMNVITLRDHTFVCQEITGTWIPLHITDKSVGNFILIHKSREGKENHDFCSEICWSMHGTQGTLSWTVPGEFVGRDYCCVVFWQVNFIWDRILWGVVHTIYVAKDMTWIYMAAPMKRNRFLLMVSLFYCCLIFYKPNGTDILTQPY